MRSTFSDGTKIRTRDLLITN